jgi:hypothetical protein
MTTVFSDISPASGGTDNIFSPKPLNASTPKHLNNIPNFVKTPNMNISEITLFNTLKIKLGEHEAQTVVEGIKTAVMEEFNTKKDILATKMDIEKLKAELLIIKWMLGFLLAGMLSLIVKSFF